MRRALSALARAELVLAALLLASCLPVRAQEARSFRENFDSLTGPALPSGWRSTRNRSTAADDFQGTSAGARSLPNAVVSTNATVAQELETPPIDVRGCTRWALSFALRRSSTHVAAVIVEVCANGETRYPLQVGDSLHPTGSTAYELIAWDAQLPPAPPDSMRIRWRVIPAGSGSAGTLRLDDVLLAPRADRDLAMRSMALAPGLAAESTLVTVCVEVENVGTQEIDGARVSVLLRRADLLAGGAVASVAIGLPGVVAPGEKASAGGAMRLPEAGAYVLQGEMDCPQDQDRSNDTLRVPVRVGPAWNRLVINEVQYSPPSSEPEWVEIMNPRENPLSIAGWSLDDGSVGKGLPAGSVIGPGEMVVLTGDSARLAVAHPEASGKIAVVPSFPQLNNRGDQLFLRDPFGAVVDSLRYQPTWGGNAEGCSLERIDWNGRSEDPLNWGTCTARRGSTPAEVNSIALRDTDLAITGLGTEASLSPGELGVRLRNVGRREIRKLEVRLWCIEEGTPAPPESALASGWSGVLAPWDSLVVVVGLRVLQGVQEVLVVCRAEGDRHRENDSLLTVVRRRFREGTLVINEIMAAPVAPAGEYVEIHNPGSEGVDLLGWTLAEGPASGSGRYAVTPRRGVIGGGGYFLVAADSSALRPFAIPPAVLAGGITVLGSASLGLNNAGDVLVLRDPTGGAVDSVAYRDIWHRPEVTTPSGRSLERIHPLLPSSDARSWTTSVDWTGGTPGRTNSVALASAPAAGTLSCAPNPFSPDGDGREDFTVIRYTSPFETGTIALRVFDSRGRCVRWLAVGEPAGANGAIVWDGRDERRKPVGLGIYVVLAELRQAGGGEWSGKAVVVVARKL
jgi:hypothetical protein